VGLEEPDAYVDTAADVVQAAVAAGWNAEDLCRAVIGQQRRERGDAEAEARHRRHQGK
jgi:hypothetical protein